MKAIQFSQFGGPKVLEYVEVPKPIQTLTGFFVVTFMGRPVLAREALQFLVDHALDGSVRPQVAKTLPLSQAAEAHRLLEGRKVKGVIVLDARA